MKLALTLLFLSALTFLQAQQIENTLTDYNMKEADVVIFSFGMDNPIKIGQVDQSGKLSVNLSEVKLPEISEANKSIFMSELMYAFSVSCGGRGDFGDKAEVPAAQGGYIALWANNEWSASIFPVSDEALQPWLEDEGYNNAIEAIFYGIIYIEEETSLNFSCKNAAYANDVNEIEINYTFNIDLKKGFNWVQYTIEEVYETDPNIRASFPTKIKISNLQDPDQMNWIPKYFF